MELRDVLRRRRMVRHFQAREVSAEAVERLVDAARRGPSAGYSQGVSFVVVTDVAVRARVAQAAGESWYLGAGHSPFISQAPVQVVVCTSEQVYRDRYRALDKRKESGVEREWPVPYWYVDAGCALMLLLLAAVDEGLSCAFVGTRDPGELREVLGIPADVVPVGVVLVGYGAPDKPSRSLARGRRPSDQVVHRERW